MALVEGTTVEIPKIRKPPTPNNLYKAHQYNYGGVPGGPAPTTTTTTPTQYNYGGVPGGAAHVVKQPTFEEKMEYIYSSGAENIKKQILGPYGYTGTTYETGYPSGYPHTQTGYPTPAGGTVDVNITEQFKSTGAGGGSITGIVTLPGGGHGYMPTVSTEAGLAPDEFGMDAQVRGAQLTTEAILYAYGLGLGGDGTVNRDWLPGTMTYVTAEMVPWQYWGYTSQEEFMKAIGYTEVPGQGWVKDVYSQPGEIGLPGGGRAIGRGPGYRTIGGGGGRGYSSGLINWRIGIR